MFKNPIISKKGPLYLLCSNTVPLELPFHWGVKSVSTAPYLFFSYWLIKKSGPSVWSGKNCWVSCLRAVRWFLPSCDAGKSSDFPFPLSSQLWGRDLERGQYFLEFVDTRKRYLNHASENSRARHWLVTVKWRWHKKGDGHFYQWRVQGSSLSTANCRP